MEKSLLLDDAVTQKIIFKTDYQIFGRLLRIFGIESNIYLSISETFSLFNSSCALIKYSRFFKKKILGRSGRDPTRS